MGIVPKERIRKNDPACKYCSGKITDHKGKHIDGYKIGLSSVDKLINDKHFDGKIQIGRRVLVSKEELDKYIRCILSKINHSLLYLDELFYQYYAVT